MSKVFSTMDLGKIFDRSTRYMIEQVEKGRIVADVVPANGTGTRRRYSYGEALRAGVGLELKERGFTWAQIKVFLDKYQEFIESPQLPSFTIRIDVDLSRIREKLRDAEGKTT